MDMALVLPEIKVNKCWTIVSYARARLPTQQKNKYDMQFNFPDPRQQINFLFKRSICAEIKKIAESKGITPSEVAEVLIEQAVKEYNAKDIIKQEIIEKPESKKHKGWSPDFERCQECGTTRWRYAARGYCRKCYPKLLKEEKNEQLPKIPITPVPPQKRKENLENYEKTVIRSAERELPVYTFCNYLLCETKRFDKRLGVVREGKDFCCENHYQAWSRSIEDLR